MGCGVVPGNVYALSGCHCGPHSSSIINRSSFGMIGCLLSIHIFSILSSQLKKLWWHNESATDLSNANPARSHIEVQRSTGDIIMVTIRYSNLRDPNRDKLLVRSHHSRTSEICRHHDFGFRYKLQFLLSRVRTVFPNLNNGKLHERLSDVLLMHQSKVIKRDSKCFLAIGRLHEDKLLDTLQAKAPTNSKSKRFLKPLYMLHIASSLDRLGWLSPTHGQHSQQ